ESLSPRGEALGGGEVVVIAEAEKVSDELLIAHGETELATEFLAGTPPPPSRCGRLRYKPCQIMRKCAVPSIKVVFLKELRVKSSRHWS
ncbi:MAG TPA: hypothetical protein VF126_11185, partial [Acidobacteriaceae bacterium]